MTRHDVCARCGHPRSVHETVPSDHKFRAPRKKTTVAEPPIGRAELRAIIRAELERALAPLYPSEYTVRDPYAGLGLGGGGDR